MKKNIWSILIILSFINYFVPNIAECKQILDNQNIKNSSNTHNNELFTDNSKNESEDNPKDEESTKTSSGVNEKYKRLQDSIYRKLLDLNVTARSLFYFNLTLTDETWNAITRSNANLPYQAALQSLATVPPSAFAPTGTEQVAFESNLEAAQNIPGIAPHRYGLKIPLRDIGEFFGLVEDVSPEIKYTLDAADDIEIVIYSIQAKVVATLFKGRQVPGSYQITWNFRDDNGRRLPSGDYIGEVRIGNVKFIRKRILLP